MAAFEPGQSGNPAGRPKGVRSATALTMEALLEGEADAITRKAIELAKAGDTAMIRLCMDRLCPPRKDRFVTFELPKLNRAADAVQASAAMVEAVAKGDLTPSEAGELSKIVDAYTRALQATDFEERLAKLEAAKK